MNCFQLIRIIISIHSILQYFIISFIIPPSSLTSGGILPVKLHLVRHAETTANRAGILQEGHTDYPLTEEGVQDALGLGDFLQDYAPIMPQHNLGQVHHPSTQSAMDDSIELDSKQLENPLMDGVIFFGIKNHRQRFFIPSCENVFGEKKYPKVLIDSGCSSILLPLSDANDLTLLLEKYPSARKSRSMLDYHWKIATSSNVGGSTPVLLIEKDPSVDSFPVCLMKDIFPSNKFSLKRLRFSLCTDDITFLLETPEFRRVFTVTEMEKLSDLKGKTISRRSHALLGQDVLSSFSCITHGSVSMFFNVKLQTNISFGWIDARLLGESLKESVLLPPGFADWEDEYYPFYDDEEYFLLADDMVDEDN